MPHILAKQKNVKVDDMRALLTEHAPIHAQYGLYMEQVWQNLDDINEVHFLFRTDDLAKAKEFILNAHKEAREQDPNINLPEMTFLE